MWRGLKYAWNVLFRSVIAFFGDGCFRFSAALSFYTLFSIAPIVLITLYVAGIFFDDSTFREEITERFRELIGEQGAQGIFILMEVVADEDEDATFSLVAGLAFLAFSATTIFVQIKNGFNDIFLVRAVEGRKGWIKLLRDRVVSFGLVISLGFAMIISLVLDTLILSLVQYVTRDMEELSLVLVQVFQNLLILALVFGVILALFRWLPDAVIPRHFLYIGALITTILLLLGKFLIGWYISRSNFSELGGAAASIVILMLWVYYSSVILFLGAEVVKAQTEVSRLPYHAGPYAKKVKVVEIDDDGSR